MHPDLYPWLVVVLSIVLIGTAVLLLALDAKLSKRPVGPLEPLVLPAPTAQDRPSRRAPQFEAKSRYPGL